MTEYRMAALPLQYIDDVTCPIKPTYNSFNVEHKDATLRVNCLPLDRCRSLITGLISAAMRRTRLHHWSTQTTDD